MPRHTFVSCLVWSYKSATPLYHSSPLQIGKRGYNLQELTKIGQLKTGKRWPGRMSLDFCLDIQMVESECGVNRMSRLVVVVWRVFSWHTLGPLVPIGHRLNTTAYLSPSSDGCF